MFVSAMFWRVRYPTAEAKPEVSDVVLFGMIAAVLNVPVVALFEEFYSRLGAAVVVREKRLMLGEHIIKGDDELAAQRASLHVRTVHDAEQHLYVVHGAVMHTKDMVENQKTRHALMQRGSSMSKMSLLELEEYEEKYEKMKVQKVRAEKILSEKKQHAKEADERALQLARMKHERELYGAVQGGGEIQEGTGGQGEGGEGDRDSTSGGEENIKNSLNAWHSGSSRELQSPTKQIISIANTASSPQEKKNKIPSKYLVQESEGLGSETESSSSSSSSSSFRKKAAAQGPKACAWLRLKWRMISESKKRTEEKRVEKLSKEERLIEEKLKKKNIIVQQLYDFNKTNRDPGLDHSPAPFWIRNLLDFVAFSLVLFFCYFIVAFGFYYGQDVARSWLEAFLLSVMADFMFITPGGILFRVVVLPRIVVYAVFQGDPELEKMADTPLMSGAVGALGPTGQHAYALGLSSVAAVGSTGSAAKRWLQKTAQKRRQRQLQSKVRYVGTAENPYQVSMTLEKKFSNVDQAVRQKNMYHRRQSKYANAAAVMPGGGGLGLAHGIDANELSSFVEERNERFKNQEGLVRASIEEQEKKSALQVASSTEEEMLDAVLIMLLSGVVLPEVKQQQHHAVVNEVTQHKE